MSTHAGTPFPLHFEEVSVSIEPPPGDMLKLEEALEDSAFFDNEVVLEQPHRLAPLPRRWATSHSKLSSLRALNSSSRQAQYRLKNRECRCIRIKDLSLKLNSNMIFSSLLFACKLREYNLKFI